MNLLIKPKHEPYSPDDRVLYTKELLAKKLGKDVPIKQIEKELYYNEQEEKDL